MTLAQQLQHGRVYRSLKVAQARRARASAAIAAMMRHAPKSYVSVSWGKQSIIVAHMVYQRDPSLPCYFLASSESWALHNFQDVIDAFVSRWPVRLQVVQTDRWNDAASWTAARHAGRHDLQRMADPDGPWDGWYTGLAREESRARQIALSMRSATDHPDVYQYRDGSYRCAPLASWEMADLASYLDEFNLPLLAIYHRHGLEARSTARITRQMIECGGAVSTRESRAAWNMFCARFPELRTWR